MRALGKESTLWFPRMKTGRGSEWTPSPSATAPPPTSSPPAPLYTAGLHALPGSTGCREASPLPCPAGLPPAAPSSQPASHRLANCTASGPWEPPGCPPGWWLRRHPPLSSCLSPTQHPGSLPLAQPRPIPQPRPLLPSEPPERREGTSQWKARGQATTPTRDDGSPGCLRARTQPLGLSTSVYNSGSQTLLWSRHQNEMPGACSSQPHTAPSSALEPPRASHRPGPSHQTLGLGQHTAHPSQTLTGGGRGRLARMTPSSSDSSCSPGCWARLSRSDLTQRL